MTYMCAGRFTVPADKTDEALSRLCLLFGKDCRSLSEAFCLAGFSAVIEADGAVSAVPGDLPGAFLSLPASLTGAGVLLSLADLADPASLSLWRASDGGRHVMLIEDGNVSITPAGGF